LYSKMVATSGKPNACSINQELACSWWTRVLLIFNPTWHSKSIRMMLEVKRVQRK
jgi:hypothetical protein